MTFKTQPYAHQLHAFERFKDADYFALFADMGTGKTKIAIDIAVHKFETKQINAMLIIAPNNVHTQWIRQQFPIHCSIQYRSWIWKSGQFNSKVWKRMFDQFMFSDSPILKVMAVNVEAFQSDTIVPFIADYVKRHRVFIVIDEATRIKNNTAKRTKTIHKLEKYGQRAILTGTPTAKSPFDLWSQMDFLKKGYFKCNYFIFQHRYGILVKGTNAYTGGRYNSLIDEKTYAIVVHTINKMKQERNGPLMPDDYETIAAMRGTSEKNVRFIEANPVYTKFKRLDELRDFIAKDVYSVKKADCLDLPPKIYESLYVDMTIEQKRIYRTLRMELLAQYNDKELTVTNKVALTTRLMQIVGGFFPYLEEEQHTSPNGIITVKTKTGGELIGTNSPKLDAIRDDLEEVDFDNTKVIIWAHFVSELKFIYDELKTTYKCCLYYGGTPDGERKRIIEDFQAGKYDIFIGNAATAGFGLNLQNATLQYYYSNTFRTEDRLQAEDRSHRIGVKSSCVYKDVIVKGTIDEKIHTNISQGRDLNDYFKSVPLVELLLDTVDTDEEPVED